ncbi:MAG: enoyl-CoA hydratase-related protein [Halioglobus sp.]
MCAAPPRAVTLGLNFTTLGVLPGLGSTYHLPRLVGMGKALELVLSGAKLSSDDACAIGLVQRVCAPGEVYEEARQLALAMARVRPEVLAAARKALRLGASASLEDAIANEKSPEPGAHQPAQELAVKLEFAAGGRGVPGRAARVPRTALPE